MTNQWFKSDRLKSETKGFIIAAQDQAIKTNYYASKILKDGADSVCMICGQFQETMAISWQGALSWPKLNFYIDMTKPPHNYTGTSPKS